VAIPVVAGVEVAGSLWHLQRPVGSNSARGGSLHRAEASGKRQMRKATSEHDELEDHLRAGADAPIRRGHEPRAPLGRPQYPPLRRGRTTAGVGRAELLFNGAARQPSRSTSASTAPTTVQSSARYSRSSTTRTLKPPSAASWRCAGAGVV